MDIIIIIHYITDNFTDRIVLYIDNFIHRYPCEVTIYV